MLKKEYDTDQVLQADIFRPLLPCPAHLHAGFTSFDIKDTISRTFSGALARAESFRAPTPGTGLHGPSPTRLRSEKPTSFIVFYSERGEKRCSRPGLCL